ncbi:hypothetical protein J8J42_03165 [Chryseobacterium sp. cx-311]|uniref:hypothetical protein n=1 Tax=Marnyiella aurantia TaxID=2758037 RepID=UPI001AE8A91A|nr:hypothetical protein [Marnyiella aurantia]MBP0612045.1 hypothetical protein [Marnyiella aurantia]
MKKFGLILFLICSYCKAQVMRDSIMGDPKYVKEYVVFLNNSGPYTFMQGDSEYGHAIITTPENLRASMRRSWFESDFCRYTNNETYYDKDGKITAETWYYKSGEILRDYNYKYDSLGRLMKKKSKSKYSTSEEKFIYAGISKKLKFTESHTKWENEPTKTYFNNREFDTPFILTKFDTLSRTDSIFTVTDFIWKKVGENSFQRGYDSVFRQKLTQVNYYDKDFQIKESKFYDYETDYYNKKLFQKGHTKFERDSLGRIIKETQLQDDKYTYLILDESGKYHEEIKKGGYASVSSTQYTYFDDGKLNRKTHYYQGNLQHQIRFEYDKHNQIKKLFYLDNWGENKKDRNPTMTIFKYKLDKYNNWIECIKNVDGEDLYLWKREIQYYR